LSKGGVVGEVEALFFSDRTLLPQRPNFVPASGQCCTVRACVGSQVTYADVESETWRAEERKGSDATVRPVAVDLTRLIKKIWLWMLTGNDLTLGSHGEQRVRSWHGLGARERNLT
jgi:hypothetical protein